MKKILLLILLSASAGVTQLSAQTLTGFGSGDLNPTDVTPVTGDIEAPWVATQNTTSITVTAGNAGAGGIQEVFAAPVAITQGTNFLTLTGATIANPPTNQSFTIRVYDASLNDYLAYQFVWSEFTSTGNAFTGMLSGSSGTFSGGAGGFELIPGGLQTETVTYRFDNLAFTATGVPEPSTYAMLGLGLLALHFVRRKTARA